MGGVFFFFFKNNSRMVKNFSSSVRALSSRLTQSMKNRKQTILHFIYFDVNLVTKSVIKNLDRKIIQVLKRLFRVKTVSISLQHGRFVAHVSDLIPEQSIFIDNLELKIKNKKNHTVLHLSEIPPTMLKEELEDIANLFYFSNKIKWSRDPCKRSKAVISFPTILSEEKKKTVCMEVGSYKLKFRWVDYLGEKKKKIENRKAQIIIKKKKKIENMKIKKKTKQNIVNVDKIKIDKNNKNILSSRSGNNMIKFKIKNENVSLDLYKRFEETSEKQLNDCMLKLADILFPLHANTRFDEFIPLTTVALLCNESNLLNTINNEYKNIREFKKSLISLFGNAPITPIYNTFMKYRKDKRGIPIHD